MRTIRKFIKTIAAFLFVNTLCYIFFPSVALALTSGPAAPEYSSFEPFDATDMVNLQTGDFVYNSPIMEIPGPAGGFPVSLAYHAGIRPNEEASWVGLGWTLNVGAINRTVNVYPDDSYNEKRSSRSYWQGGIVESKSFKPSINLPLGIGVYANYTINDDSNKGRSTKLEPGISFDGASLAGSVANRIAARSRTMADFSNVPQNRNSSVGISLFNFVRNSIENTTNELTQTNNNAGSINNIVVSKNHEFLPGLMSVTSTTTRYWSDATSDLNVFGSLYNKDANNFIDGDVVGGDEDIFYSFDSFSQYDDWATNEIDPNQQLGASLPSYDQYNVLGNGVSGRISPYIFENGDLFQQTTYEKKRNSDGEYEIDQSNTIIDYISKRKFQKSKVDFRYVNDFSNSLEILPQMLDISSSSVSLHNITSPSEGLINSSEKLKLVGSNNIQWFTNEEIKNGFAGTFGFEDHFSDGERQLSYDITQNYLQPEMFLPKKCINNDGGGSYGGPILHLSFSNTNYGAFTKDHYPLASEEDNVFDASDNYVDCDFPRFDEIEPINYDISKKIGGFMITKQDGLTYHYSLPVYVKNQYRRVKKRNPEDGIVTFQEYNTPEPYAYTWLLTAITGPDYVDRDGEGISDNDWGYWVKFDYGLWASDYQWRSPHTGYDVDIQSGTETFSYGIKELYYLDAIETSSHKAFFVKSFRKDARGVTSRLEGGSNPRDFNVMIDKYSNSDENDYFNYSISPVGTLKLDRIYLMDKRNLTSDNFDKTAGNSFDGPGSQGNPIQYTYNGVNLEAWDYNSKYPETRWAIQTGDKLEVFYHNGDGVLDEDDIILQKTELESKSSRIVEFNYDYSLQPETPNSFDNLNEHQDDHSCDLTDFDFPFFDGQLSFGGDFTLPTEFQNGCVTNDQEVYNACGLLYYDYDLLDFCEFYSDGLAYNSEQRFAHFDCYEFSNYVGGRYKFYNAGKLTLKSINSVGNSGLSLIPPTKFDYEGETNSNPWYNANKLDSWGYYNSSYEELNSGLGSKRVGSGHDNKDAWSLSKIQTSLGAELEIEYESDDYSTVVHNNKVSLPVNGLVPLDGNDVKIYFDEEYLAIDQHLSQGDEIKLTYFILSQAGNETESNVLNITDPSKYEKTAIVKSIELPHWYNNDALASITIENANLHEEVSKRDEMRDGNSVKIYPFFISGFVEFDHPDLIHGGDIRVKSLTLNSDRQFKTEYIYTDGTGSSSGILSYEPLFLENLEIPRDESYLVGEGNWHPIWGDGEVYEINIFDLESEHYDDYTIEKSRNNFQRLINAPVSEILSLSSEIPPPIVGYSNVTVRKFVDTFESPTYGSYEFATYNSDMVDKESTITHNGPAEEIRTIKIKNLTNQIGLLKSHKVYQTSSDKLINETGSTYLHDDKDILEYEDALVAYNKQGVVQQSFHQFKTVKDDSYTPEDPDDDIVWTKGSTTWRSEYPVIPIGSFSKNYISGTETESKTLAFDFYSGMPTEIYSKNSNGDQFVTKSVPAYRLQQDDGDSQYSRMGPQGIDSDNFNMLTQEGATYNYKLSDDFDITDTEDLWQNNKQALIAASIQTWSNDIEIKDQGTQSFYRKYSNYSWWGTDTDVKKDGTFRLDNFDEYLFASDGYNEVEDYGWERLNTISMYDVNSHALEAFDRNSTYASVKYDDQNARVISTSSDSRYHDFIATGFERYDHDQLQYSHGFASIGKSHTGDYGYYFSSPGNLYYSLDASDLSRFTAGKKYIISYWTNASDGSVYPYCSAGPVVQNHHSTEQSIVKNGETWYLHEAVIEIPSGISSLEVGVVSDKSENIIDDFKFYPLSSGITSYVYNDLGQLSDIMGSTNLATHYEYDDIGRLKSVWTESFQYGFKKISETKINYLLNQN